MLSAIWYCYLHEMLFSSGTADAKLGIGLSEYALVYNGASLDRCILSLWSFCETFSFVQLRNCTNHRQQNKVRGRVVIWFFRATDRTAPGRPGQQQLVAVLPTWRRRWSCLQRWETRLVSRQLCARGGGDGAAGAGLERAGE